MKGIQGNHGNDFIFIASSIVSENIDAGNGADVVESCNTRAASSIVLGPDEETTTQDIRKQLRNEPPFNLSKKLQKI